MKLSLERERFSQSKKLNQIKEKIMNSRWRQIFKNFKKWNTRIQKAYGFKHRCLSKTERKKIKQERRALRKANMEFEFEE